MWIELGVGAFLIGAQIYHRLTEEKDPETGEGPRIPTTESGSPLPLVFGRCRVPSVLSWASPLEFSGENYPRMNQLHVLGLGFEHGNGSSRPFVENRLHAIYANRKKLTIGGTLSSQTGDGFEFNNVTIDRNDVTTTGQVEFLNGKPTQQLVDDNGDAVTYAGAAMLDAGLSADDIPGYRHRLAACLVGLQTSNPPEDPDDPLELTNPFVHGAGADMPAYEWEVSSLYAQTGAQPLGIYGTVGQDANPIAVIYEVLVGAIGKLGLPTSIIDMDSFNAAAYTLWTESHGYSRHFPERTPAADIIFDVCRQIDALPYTDHRTGKIGIKLIRADYAPNELLEINNRNCRGLAGLALRGRTNVTNEVVVKFRNRSKDYADDIARAPNLANTYVNDGQMAPQVVEYLGCNYEELAVALASRENAVRSRPVLKCRAVGLSRRFLRVNRGDAIRLVYKNPDVNAIMRVMNVNRGTRKDGSIELDLINDTSYVWRNANPQPPGFGGELIPDLPTTIGG